MKKKKQEEIIINRKKFFSILLLWVFIFAIGLVKKTFQNDTFYTIKIGKLIIENGIDMLDHFSFHNLIYTYPHWLYDVFIYIVYYLGGFKGIYISTIILDLILLFIVFRSTSKITNSYLSPFVITIVCAIIMGQGFATARAQLVSYILFALELFFIEMYIKNKEKKYIVGLLLISLLLCNTHVAVWPFYYILFLPYLAEGIVIKILNKIKSNNKFIKYLKNKIIMDDEIPILNLLVIMFLSLFTGLITPIKDTPYTYLIKTMKGNSQKYIQEHQMSTLKDSIFPLVMAGETLLLTFISKIKLRDLFLLLGLLLMSFMSLRHVGLLTVGTTICFTRSYKSFTDIVDIDTDRVFYKAFRNKILIIISFILVIIFSIFNIKAKLKDPYVDESLYPVEASKFIKENIDIEDMRLFNDYDYGSYLLFKDIPVFIDSRADLYTKEFSGLSYDIFDDYMNITINPEKKLSFYDITHVILYKKRPLNGILRVNSNYKMIYEDKDFIIYERNTDEEE